MYKETFYGATCPLHHTDILHSYTFKWELSHLMFKIVGPWECTQFLLQNKLHVYHRGVFQLYRGPIPKDFGYHNAPQFVDRLLELKAFL